MKKIRIKKDILVTWSILKDGEPFNLEGRDLRVEIVTPKCKAFTDFNVVGNHLGFTFYGIDQHHLGKYSLTLWENYGKKGQTVLDKTNAFELVSNSDLETEEESDVLQIVTIELSNDVTDQGDIVLYNYYPKGYIDEINALLASQIEAKVNTTTFNEKVAEIENKYALKKDIPSLDGYATEQWVENNYSPTSHTHSQYALKSQLFSGDYNDLKNKPTKVSAFENDSNYINRIKTVNGETLIGEGDIEIKGGTPYDDTEIRQEIADTKAIAESKTTMAEVEAKGYLTEETEPQYNEDKPNIATKDEIPSLDGYATEQWVENKHYLTAETEPLFVSVRPFLASTSDLNNYSPTSHTHSQYSLTSHTHAQYALDSDLKELDEKVDKLELYKFPNATIFGTPTINNGQVSDFSNDNYLQFPFLVDFKNRQFRIDFSFTTSDDVINQQNILDSYYGMAFAVRNSQLVLVASENGQAWTTSEMMSPPVITPNTTYYIRIVFTDYNHLIASYSQEKDDQYPRVFGYVEMGATPYPRTILIGRSYVENGNHFKGSINLNDAKLYIDDIYNNIVWQGMDDVGLATRAAVDLSNIDAKGEEVIDNRIDNKISTKQDTLISGTNIKTINNESILGEGNIEIKGGGDYLPLSGGTLSGRIQIGDFTSNLSNAILHIRNVSSSITSHKVNGACYSVNSDGTATLQHKVYNDDGSGAKNDAVLRMSNNGLQFAINTSSSATPSEDMYKEIATQEYVNNKIGDIETLLSKI